MADHIITPTEKKFECHKCSDLGYRLTTAIYMTSQQGHHYSIRYWVPCCSLALYKQSPGDIETECVETIPAGIRPIRFRTLGNICGHCGGRGWIGETIDAGRVTHNFRKPCFSCDAILLMRDLSSPKDKPGWVYDPRGELAELDRPPPPHNPRITGYDPGEVRITENRRRGGNYNGPSRIT
jgi:hypothetical protein